MIRIDVVRDLRDMKDMIPHFVLLGSSPEHYVEKLAERLTRDPNGLLILQGRDDDKKRKLRCFSITEDPGLRYNFVNNAQTWCLESNSRKLVDYMFKRVILWAVSRGKTYIRGETNRNLAAIERRFGFKPVGTIIMKELKTKDIDEYLKTIGGLM